MPGAPVTTWNALGNALASQSLAAGANVTFNLDLSAAIQGQLEIEATFGTIAATAGLRIEVFAGFGSTPTYSSTNPNISYTLPAVVGVQRSPKLMIPTGKWQVRLTNTDATNGLTSVRATMDTFDSLS